MIQVGLSLWRKNGGAGLPAWLPLADGSAPTIYADFASDYYWYNGTQVADFATFLTLLNGTLDGSSTRYYTDVNGVLVGTTGRRKDYDPITHVARGILLEGARTNLALRSQEFNNAAWIKSQVTISADAVAAPDGTTTADKVIEGATNTLHTVYQGPITVSSGAVYTWSVFCKAAERTWVAIDAADDAGNHPTWFDLANGVVGTNGAGNTASIIAYPNGWYRCVVTRTTGHVNAYHQTDPTTADNVLVYLGDITKGLYVWGAQLELGSFASSYIPTTSGTVTRAADSLVFTPISGWFNAAAGTVFEKLKLNGLTAADDSWSFNDGTTANELTVYQDPTSKLYIRAGAATSADFAAGSNQTVVAGTSFKIASAFASNNAAHVKDAGTAGTDSTVTIPTVDRLKLGAAASGGSQFGTIEQFGYWNTRVLNSGLQALTT